MADRIQVDHVVEGYVQKFKAAAQPASDLRADPGVPPGPLGAQMMGQLGGKATEAAQFLQEATQGINYSADVLSQTREFFEIDQAAARSMNNGTTTNIDNMPVVHPTTPPVQMPTVAPTTPPVRMPTVTPGTQSGGPRTI